MKKSQTSPIKIIGIVAACVIILLWVMTELLHVLPASFIWPLRIGLLACGIGLYFVASSNAKSAPRRKNTGAKKQ